MSTLYGANFLDELVRCALCALASNDNGTVGIGIGIGAEGSILTFTRPEKR